jgi:hypothetical protein
MDVDDDQSSRPRRRPAPPAYYIATPTGAPLAPGASLEGERRGREDILRENVRRSRPTPSSRETMEDENARLRETLQRNEFELFELSQQLDRARFEHSQTRERLRYYQDKERDSGFGSDRRTEARSYHPYPRPEHLDRYTPASRSPREPSAGPDRSIPSRQSGPRLSSTPSTRAYDASPRVPTERQVPLATTAPVSGAPTETQVPPLRPEQAPSTDPYEGLESDDEYEDTDRDRREINRVQRAIGRAARGNRQVPPPPKLSDSTPELHGIWANTVVETVEQWDTIREAAISGDDTALRYCMYLNTKFQLTSTRERSRGIQSLMKGYNALIKHDRVADRYNQMRVRIRKGRGPPGAGPTDVGPPSSSNAASSNAASGSGSSATVIPSTSSSGNTAARPPRTRPGPEASLKELVKWWSGVRVPNWPEGMKLFNHEVPTDGMLGNSTPDKDDVAAMRFLLETNPPRRHQDASTKLARLRYRTLFIQLFSVYGLYPEYVTRMGSTRGDRPRAPFPFDTRNMELYHIALWLFDHGLDPASDEAENIERWAVEVRSRSETHDADGIWECFPRGLKIVREAQQLLMDNLRIHFAYPPIAHAVGARGYVTSSESYVADNRRNVDLDIIPLEAVSSDDEPDDTVMGDVSSQNNTGSSSVDSAVAKGPA